MARMLQVRHLPDEVHERLKERAKAERMSLSDYVARELTKLVAYRSNEEVFAAARRIGPRLTREEIVETIREIRGE